MTNKADELLYGDRGFFGLAPTPTSTLHREFLAPPFTVLEARAGEWQARKRAWLGLGIQSELGRGDNLIKYSKQASLGKLDTSVFDPVLCELVYRWWCPEGGVVVDPFAGGSVRGVVAAVLGLRYWGCDLREEQIEANREQAAEICQDSRYHPKWTAGDARTTLGKAPLADLVFTCPPYGSLEKYSDLPSDLSNMDETKFRAAYRSIIRRASKRTKPTAAAAMVVGNYRRKDGTMVDLVGMTVEAWEAAGFRLYNEAVVLTATGSAAMRARRVFRNKKLTKVHQNLLTFVKQ